MDTVEWGGGRPPAKTRRTAWRRVAVTTTGGRRAAAVAAVLGFAGLVASELLPWTALHSGATNAASSGDNLVTGPSDVLPNLYSIGLDRLSTTGTLAYQFGMVLLLGLVGAALVGGPAHRRTALGLALGALAAQIVIVAGLVHSFADYFLGVGGLAARQLPAGYSTSVDSGTFCAVASLALLLAALLISALPARVRAQLIAGASESAGEGFTDAPVDLTVTPVNPIDESYFSRSSYGGDKPGAFGA